MLEDARFWLMGGLALASVAGRGSSNKFSGGPRRVSVTLAPTRPRRGVSTQIVQISGSPVKLHASPGLGEEVSVYELGADYIVVVAKPGSPHISWERFDGAGRLLEDRFLHGPREVSRWLGADWADLRPAQVASLLSGDRRAA